MKSLDKIISRYMYRITAILVFFIVLMLFFVQLFTEQLRAVDDAHITLQQMTQLIDENQKELKKIEEEYYQTCLNNAELVARILESDPDAINNLYELKRIAKSVEIDEIHIFDETGKIYAGTHPKYYNLTFDSGEQIMFFKPMLKDKSLKLVQDITPNTAESKPMQYSAVWSGNGEFIVQIGMEPVNVMKVTEKNELSYIFSLFRVSPDANYYAINCQTGEIVGSSIEGMTGKSASDVGFNMERIETDPDGFHNEIDGTLCFCVFEKIGENYHVGRVVNANTLYRRAPMTVFWTTLALIVLSVILANAMIEYMDKCVVKGIHDVNEKLQSISEGNLEEIVDVENSKEFMELSSYINEMVKSLLSNNERMSYILSKTNLHMGTYEFGGKLSKVRYTEHIPLIFGKDEKSMETLSSDKGKFSSFIEGVKTNPVKNETGIYHIGEKYIRIEETENEGVVFGIVVDVTDEIQKLKNMERERDVDDLTGLYNRRGLTEKLDELFTDREALGQSAVIMIDADGLKQINDTYGHEKGDIYLKKIADIINNFGIKSSVASRQGGDEFVLFLYGYDSEEELMRAIETLQYIQSNSKATLEKGLTVPLKFSLGYAIAEENSEYQDLFKIADEEMYKNKTERKKKQRENKE